LSEAVVARKGANYDWSPRLVSGLRKISETWQQPLDTDGKAIAHARTLLSKLQQPQHYEAAIARFLLAWEEGKPPAATPREGVPEGFFSSNNYDEIMAHYGAEYGWTS